MKNYILLFVLLFPWWHFGQEEGQTLKFHSASLSPNFYSGNNATGFMGNLDLAFKIDEHILKASVMAAAEVDIWTSYKDNYYSYDLMYGREFMAARSIAIDLFGGVGYLHFKTRNPDTRQKGYVDEKTIGFPLQGRVRFRHGKVFNMGIQIHANVNSASSIIAVGPFFQWNFHPSKSKD